MADTTEAVKPVPKDELTVPEASKVNGTSAKSGHSSPARAVSPSLRDGTDNPYTQLIDSLRNQNNELFSQVTALNAKLVQSYDRLSDLEDNDHALQNTLRAANIRISQLELERMDHLAALDTGLLVEKAHVTSELSRLMERVSDEAARRGQAETAKKEIEKDLDDLSATLFNQANTMVAEARFERAKSERKATEAENAMKTAEEAVALMQTQMQSLMGTREQAEKEAQDLRELMSKGKWVPRERQTSLTSVSSSFQPQIPRRLFSGHPPYEEFLAFVAHLRSLRPTTLHPPVLSSLLPLPFLARLINEDSDPTLRLDLAPSLNWLNRRAVQTAIQQGQLDVEPSQSTALIAELSGPMGFLSTADVVCALCGKAVFHPPLSPTDPPPSHPMTTRPSWANSTSRFIKSSLAAASSPAPSAPTTPPAGFHPPTQIFIFRIAVQAPQKATPYPLCNSTWCLTRIRTTCELWRFVRKGIVDKIWEEEISRRPSLAIMASGNGSQTTLTPAGGGASPQTESGAPVPPRRRGVMKMASLWGKSLNVLGVDTSNPSSPSTNSPSTETNTSSPTTQSTAPKVERTLPPPPPPLDEKDKPAPALPARNRARQSTVPAEATGVDGKAEPPSLPPRHPTTQVAPTTIEEPEPSETKNIVDEPAHDSPKKIEEEITLNEDTPQVKPNSELAATTSEPTTTTGVPSRPSTPVKRPSTPTSIPLPSSVPSTPKARATGTGSPVTPAASLPNVPPPVPRRAAARRPATPNRNSLLPSARKDTEGEGSPERGKKRDSLIGLISPKKKDLANDGVDGAKTDSRPSSPAPALAPALQLAASVEPSAKTESTVPEESVKEPAPPSVTTDVKTEPAQAALPPTETETKDEHKRSESTATTTDGEANPETDSGGMTFVGDKTWEDRTWKELVRLRTEMYWARVGSSWA